MSSLSHNSKPDVIRNHDYLRQVVDFSGLRYGRSHPMDLDGLVEFGGRLFVFFELKFGAKEVPFGQRLALDHIVDAIHNPQAGRYAVCFIAQHCSTGDIDAAKAQVIEYRWNGQWHSPKNADGTLFHAIDAFGSRYLPDWERWQNWSPA